MALRVKPWLAAAACAALSLGNVPATAAPPEAPPEAPAQGDFEETVLSTAIPELRDAPSLEGLAGKPITRVDVVTLGGRWASPLRVTSIRLGEPVSIEAGRRAMRELLATGRFARASVTAAASPDEGGAVLVVSVVPRRIIAAINVHGSVLDTQKTLEAAGVTDGGEVTAATLGDIASKSRAFYVKHGFPSAAVNVDAIDTDDPQRVSLSIDIKSGPPRIIARRVFVIEPRADQEVGDLKLRYALGSGARVDEEALREADRELAEALRAAGFHRAEVTHGLQEERGQSFLYVYLTPGPRIVPSFDGNRAFDSAELAKALSASTETRASELVEKLRSFYVERGFLDVEIRAEEQGKPGEPVHYLAFTIRENQQVRVVRRVFPCLPSDQDPDDVGKEIESFLAEELPGSDSFWSGDPRTIVSLFGPTEGSGGRAKPLNLIPAMTYAPETYERALKHLRDLFHSRGYLNAVIGPVSVVRATCDRRSPEGRCAPAPTRATVAARCHKDALGLPEAEPPVPDALMCRPDPARHVECSPEITLRIPMHLGPQTVLYDLAFEGNRTFTDVRLAEVADLALGKPLSNLELEAARLRVLDEYRKLGYAYAEVRTAIEPSPDRTRARARFVVTERDLVVVSGFVVRGNAFTDESLIMSRMALHKDEPFRQDLVRLSEERVATLGPFSSVSIGLEDADVPQKNKRVVVTVAEQLPQYLDPRIGFSTGEGLRFAFEYGHRNIAGRAIAFTLSVQLSYLFEFITLDTQVRDNYALLSIQDRLERRNTASVTFPEIGLGPLVALSLDGIDVRDNQRDFGLTKDALIPTLTYRPRRTISAQLGASVELNDVQVFQCVRSAAGCDQTAEKDIERLLLAPKGRTLAFAQQVKVGWDGRDNPFAATKGLLLAGGVEHVNAFPSEVFGNRAEIKSHFLRFTGKAAGYFRLGSSGASVAMSLSGGYNLQLNDTSETYPDRLFFLGGVDSLRAFLADSVVPEDVAKRIKKGEIKIEDVRIRGGDLSLNPRVELRFPVSGMFNAGVFLDTGNLWVKPSDVNLFDARYAAGAGLRITTPIGPLALDYGINLLRRDWEDFGAFHFSIGLF